MHIFVIVLHVVLQQDIKYNATKYLSVFVCGTKHEKISKPKKIPLTSNCLIIIFIISLNMLEI